MHRPITECAPRRARVVHSSRRPNGAARRPLRPVYWDVAIGGFPRFLRGGRHLAAAPVRLPKVACAPVLVTRPTAQKWPPRLAKRATSGGPPNVVPLAAVPPRECLETDWGWPRAR